MDNNVTFQVNIAGNVFAGVGRLHGDFTQFVTIVDKVDNSINLTFSNFMNKLSRISLNAIIDQVQYAPQLFESPASNTCERREVGNPLIETDIGHNLRGLEWTSKSNFVERIFNWE